MAMTDEQRKRRQILKARAVLKARKAKTKASKVPASKTVPTGAMDVSKLREILARTKRGFGNRIKMQAGKNKLRFLMNQSSVDGDDNFSAYCRRTYVPVDLTDPTGKGKMINSPTADDASAYCPATALARALRTLGDTLSAGSVKDRVVGLASDMQPADRWASNVLHFTGGAWVQGVYEYGVTVFQGCANLLVADLEDGDHEIEPEDNIFHEEHGKMIIIEKTGEGLNTRYTVTGSQKSGTDVTDEHMAARHDVVKDTVETPDSEAEGILCSYWGIPPDEFEDLIADPAQYPLPPRDKKESSIKLKKTRTARPPVDDDDEYDDDIDDDEDLDLPAADEDLDPDESIDEVDELIGDSPTCLAAYGKPAKGEKCASCEYAEVCEAVTEDD